MLFDGNSSSKPRRKLAKTAFQDIGKSKKISERESKDYHILALEKAKVFLATYEDPCQAVTHSKNSDKKDETNL